MPVETAFRLPEGFFQDPHETYRLLDARGPVHYVEFPNGMRAWMVTDYEVAKVVLSDPTVSKDLYGTPGATAQDNGNVTLRLDPRVNDHMLYADPPRHTRLRNIAMQALSGRAVQDLTPRVSQIAAALLRDMADRESVDLIGAYAMPLAITVISELLGIPAADRSIFQGWLSTQLSLAEADEKYAAAANFKDYIGRLVEERRNGAAGDLLSELIATADAGERLNESELVAMVNALLLGSQETTSSLIGNAVLIMLGDPRIFEELRRDPEAIDPFLDEVLRFEGSVNMASYRFTTAPITLGAHTIDAGQILLVALASANRCPRAFADPAAVDLGRLDNRHIAFGYGIHRCVGAALARKEVQIALTSLIEAYPELTLDGAAADLRWQSSVITRGLVALPVRPGPHNNQNE